MFNEFQNVHDLACADEEMIRACIRPLGMHSRARQLKSSALMIEDKFDGRVPDDYNALMSLPGVGPYVAGVVEVFGFGNSYPLIDSNVERLLGRIEGVEHDSKANISDRLDQIYLGECPKGEERNFHHGLLDIAAMYCRPTDPECPMCPLAKFCRSRRQLN
jgi:A/G-specific adenine glycosylase